MSRIDILSDPICPWCYIGKAHLDQALATRPGHGLQIEWHPFQLNPDMPPEGMGRKDYLETKFGGPKGAKSVYDRIEETASKAGLDVRFDRIRRTPNTIDAHRLIHWAGLEGLQHSLMGALFVAYFEEGRDIGNKDVLADIAGETGLDAAMMRHLLDTEADAEDIRTRDAHARARGVAGVPTFILAQKHAVPGAQPPELWAKVLEELLPPSPS